MPICYDKKLIFIHIPKTAGTYVERYLKTNNTGDATYIYYKETYPDEWKSYKKFSIVRNPISRFVSLCKFSLMENTEKDVNIPFWGYKNYQIPNNVHKYDDYFLEKKDKIELNQEEIKKILKEGTINGFVDLIYMNNYRLPFHPWYPQSFYICDKNNNITVNEVIRFENLQLNSLNIDFKKYKKVNKSFVFDDKIIKLNNESIEKLFEIYKRDFKIFNYQNPLIKIRYF